MEGKLSWKHFGENRAETTPRQRPAGAQMLEDRIGSHGNPDVRRSATASLIIR